MFKRVRDSLVYPAEILRYRKDHILLVLLYLLFFAALLSTRTIIDVVKFDGLSVVTKETVKEEINIIDNNCEIVSAELICTGEHLINAYSDSMYTVYLDSNDVINYDDYPNDEYSLIIHDEAVYLYVFGINTVSIPLTDLPTSLQNIDFNDQASDPEAFYSHLFTGIDELIVSYKSAWGTALIAVEMFISILFYMIFLLFSSFFMKKRYKIIPFKETFTMTVYSSTSLYIILTFYSMLDLNIIIVIVLLFISFRQNGILNREIDRRITKKPW